MHPRTLNRAAALLLVAVLFVAGCDALRENRTATLTGQVVNAATNRAVDGATVQVLGHGLTTSTDAQGAYRMDVEVDSAGAVTMIAYKTGFKPDTMRVQARAGQTTELPTFRLAAIGTDDPGTATGKAASISLDPRSSQTASVTGAGGNEIAHLIFVAYDASGRPIDAASAVDLDIRIVNGPGSGRPEPREFINNARIRTDENGQARTTLTSGVYAGVVQIEASAEVDGRTVRSQPISIVIHGGLPHPSHFGLAATRKNLPGGVRYGESAGFTAYVGDRYGNPVVTGTQVYFTTTAGIIEGSNSTGGLGTATVQLVTAAPFPTHPEYGPGYGIVTARTSDEGQQTIEKEYLVAFSGPTVVTVQVLSAVPGPNLSYQYRVLVRDPYGIPLTGGTSITIAADGENIRTVGQTSVEVPDALFGGPGVTEFTFGVRRGTGDAAPVYDGFTIRINSPNGSIEAGYGPGGAAGAEPPLLRKRDL